MIQDAPSPIDLRLMPDAQEWADTALLKRPGRIEFFDVFATTIKNSIYPVQRILELGSGPGFLAKHLLDELSFHDYVALDFSPAMHEIASHRIQSHLSTVKLVERSFKEPHWTENLGKFDCIVTMQAVHELRHKHHAESFFGQVKGLLAEHGFFLVCDHFVGENAMHNDQLYMTIEEQYNGLKKAGFSTVNPLLVKEGMVLHAAFL